MFYLLAIAGVLAALYVVHSTVPVRSLVFLLFTFIFSGGVLISLGLEFLGLTLIVVYAGALVILFLFVVKTLNIRREQRAALLSRSAPGFLYVAAPALWFFLIIFLSFMVFDHPLENRLLGAGLPIPGRLIWLGSKVSGVFAFSCLYSTKYLYLLVVGLILLVGVIGPVALLLADPKRGEIAAREPGSDKKGFFITQTHYNALLVYLIVFAFLNHFFV